jgi:hypothetical protein
MVSNEFSGLIEKFCVSSPRLFPEVLAAKHELFLQQEKAVSFSYEVV